MTDALTTVSLVILSAWLIVSISTQFPSKTTRSLLRHDTFSLLPLWSFFAPSPRSFDYHLLYRIGLASGGDSAWKEVLPSHQRKLLEALWNPQKRSKKVLQASLRALSRPPKGGQTEAISSSGPYQKVLNLILMLENDPEAKSIEFQIRSSEGLLGDNAPRLLFQSERHEL